MISQYLCSDHNDRNESLSNLWICDFVGIDVIRKLGRRLKNNTITSDTASLLTPLLRATCGARNHPYLQVAITCVRHVCSQHGLTAYSYLFELPLRMNGMRRTQSDPLGLGTLQGKKRQDTGNKLDNCHLFQISPILCTRGLELCGKRKNRPCRLFNG